MLTPFTAKASLACLPHDHSQCVSSALADADALCAQQGVRLTALRRRVLELVWHSHKPLGAYDILAVLSEADGRRAAPPAGGCRHRAAGDILDPFGWAAQARAFGAGDGDRA